MHQSPAIDPSGAAPAQRLTEVSATDAPPTWTGFSATWRRGFQEIFAIRLVRGSADHRERGRRRPMVLVRWFGLAYGPPLLAWAVPVAERSLERTALLLLLGTVNAGMFAAASLAWGYALRRADTIDDLLRPCPERDAVPRIIAQALRLRWQVMLPAGFALLPWALPLVTGVPVWSDRGSIVLATALTWSLFLLGNVCYWLLVAPLLVMRARSWPTLAMRWNDPARTPGIRTFSEGYAYSSSFLALAALAVTIPGMLNVPIFGQYLPYLYVLLLTLSIWVGVATQVVIYVMVRRFRLGLLDTLVNDDGFLLTEQRTSAVREYIRPETADLLTVYGSVAGAPGLPYGTALVVQYVAALVGSGVGFLLQ